MSTGSSARIWATLSGFPAQRVSSIRFTNNSALGGTRELLRVLDGVATRHYRAHGVPEKEQWHARMRFLGKCDDGSKDHLPPSPSHPRLRRTRVAPCRGRSSRVRNDRPHTSRIPAPPRRQLAPRRRHHAQPGRAPAQAPPPVPHQATSPGCTGGDCRRLGSHGQWVRS